MIAHSEKYEWRWTLGDWFSVTIRVVSLWLLLQFASVVGQLAGGWYTTHQSIDNIERRFSLDHARLDVGNPRLNTPVNEAAVKAYLDKLNNQLETLNYPVRVLRIQGVKTDQAFYDFSVAHPVQLRASEQVLTMVIGEQPLANFTRFSPYVLVLTLLVSPLIVFAFARKTQKQRSRSSQITTPEPRLIINLHNKTIGNGVDDVVVTLQNKPLCFYTALIKYCIAHPDEPLQHHKDIPDELQTLCNRVFSRLIELGHTKRKRPDFNANLDKTLSEVRAALDEVFYAFPENKDTFYPPRAQGEGSRSKQHSYAISHLTEMDVEILGL